jgi:hypothetical protein
MLISHKHKLIFVKTHKTSTQTFNNFMLDHLGPGDVVTGDPNHGTEINVDIKFDTGLCALDFREKYGNHLPWFMIKEIIGDEMWGEYKKITIERHPKDRMVSLFCFLNPLLTTLSCGLNPDIKYDLRERKNLNQSTPLKEYPEQVREYFYNWTQVQLEADVLPLTDHITYSADAIPLELSNYRTAAKKLNIDLFFYDNPSRIMHPTGKQNLCDFPPLKTDRILVPDMNFRNTEHVNLGRYLPLEGQCRFLNYGYYHDGKTQQVDHVIDYNNVADNIGMYFKENDIKINCNKQLYDNKSKNIHFRANHELPNKDWWFETPRGKNILDALELKLSACK